jgi:hypothetical protein
MEICFLPSARAFSAAGATPGGVLSGAPTGIVNAKVVA